MTTNVPEVLDKALIRPGRIDRQVYLGPLSKQNAKQIFIRMYTQDEEEAKNAAAVANRHAVYNHPDVLKMITPVHSPLRNHPATPGTPFSPLAIRSPRPASSDGWYSSGVIDDLDKLATAFMNKIPDKLLTPAEVQGFLLSHRDDMLGALTQCDNWVIDMLNAKERKSNIIKLDPAPTANSGGKARAVSSSKPLPNPITASKKASIMEDDLDDGPVEEVSDFSDAGESDQTKQPRVIEES